MTNDHHSAGRANNRTFHRWFGKHLDLIIEKMIFRSDKIGSEVINAMETTLKGVARMLAADRKTSQCRGIWICASLYTAIE